MAKTYTDEDLADLADWAEKNERAPINADAKKAYGAIRQGVDWLLRLKTRERALKTGGIDQTADSPETTKPQ